MKTGNYELNGMASNGPGWPPPLPLLFRYFFLHLLIILSHSLLVLGKDRAVVEAVQVEELSGLIGRTGLQQENKAMLGVIFHSCKTPQ